MSHDTLQKASRFLSRTKNWGVKTWGNSEAYAWGRNGKGEQVGDQRRMNEDGWEMSSRHQSWEPDGALKGREILLHFYIPTLLFPSYSNTSTPASNQPPPLSAPDTNLCHSRTCTNCSRLPPTALHLASISPVPPPLASLTAFVCPRVSPLSSSRCSYQEKGQLGSDI